MELISTPDNPVPEGALVSAVGAADGIYLRIARWTPPGPQPLGTICVFTGRGEFIEKYFETIGELVARNFVVVAMDWRGQGLSGRELDNSRKGHIDDFSLFERDLDALEKQVLQFLCPRPWYALAHSMGGAILISKAHAGTAPFDRIVLTAPMVDLYGLKFPRLTRGFAEVMDILGFGAAFIPGGKPGSEMSKPFANNVLTSDAGRHARNAGIVAAAPHLAVGDPTIGWVNAAFRLMNRFAEIDYPRQTRTPILIVAAGNDRIISTPALARFANRLKAGFIVTLPGAEHEILQETNAIREQFWAAFDAFIPGQREEGVALEEAHASIELARATQKPWYRKMFARA